MDLIPKKTSDYRDVDYWDWRYSQNDTTYDWLISHDEWILPYLNTEKPLNILILGIINCQVRLW